MSVVRCAVALGVAGAGVTLGMATEASAAPSTSAWTQRVQLTPGVKAGPSTSALQADSCLSATSCIAVGSYLSPTNTELTLTESWDGTSWTIDDATNPPPVTGVLLSMSCSAANSCTAVGYTNIPNHVLLVPFAESWNGTTWTVHAPQRIRGTGVLYGVSCPSVTTCIAVGTYDAGDGDFFPMAEMWNGTRWTLQTVPNPTTAPTNIRNGLNSISCTSPSFCTAVGSYTTGVSRRDGHTLVEVWNGTTWTIESSLDPNETQYLYGVSCTSPSACTAVGERKSGLTVLAETWNGKSWKIQNAPAPKGATSSDLATVACSSTSDCVAIGTATVSGVQETLTESLNGSTWTVQTPAIPTGASSSGTYLDGVSCGGKSTCVAVGNYDTSTGQDPLAEEWNGSKWVLQSVS
jgi:hypothetical protein